MTEREKMLMGDWYDANFDEELRKVRQKAEELCFGFNNAKPGSGEQGGYLKQILETEQLPKELWVLAPVYFDYGSYTRFGENVFVNHGCYFMDGGGITIGNNVFIGPFCGFYTANHPLDYVDRNRGLEKALPITVGDNCWFGANVTVLPGVTIGNGCVIAAGSVVSKDVEDNSLVAGVPAKRVKGIDNDAARELANNKQTNKQS